MECQSPGAAATGRVCSPVDCISAAKGWGSVGHSPATSNACCEGFWDGQDYVWQDGAGILGRQIPAVDAQLQSSLKSSAMKIGAAFAAHTCKEPMTSAPYRACADVFLQGAQKVLWLSTRTLQLRSSTSQKLKDIAVNDFAVWIAKQKASLCEPPM